MTELKETAAMMCSPDYKERFKAEYLQLAIRYEKLEKMVMDWEEGKLSFTPRCPKATYELQLEYMRKYLSVLIMRAQIEGIDLEDK